ncbi:bifunctional DedA family/phosphatase PAP2 family protein [Mangrovitalea sediminis]|uniref:bifunctional DedA family/phosphatase PAP2 family protein n=1 Tax=Mangrovitalea sediminis TaxID=1982043 RepID=UPI000BE5B8DA|nr:bifunctional DedA family/phosphatase PAP2 family protein [Mangrovitalea sediminis]
MISHWISTVSPWLTAHQNWLLVIAFVTSLLESLALIGFTVPSIPVMFAIGAIAAGSGMNALPLLAWSALGAALGDIMSYLLGRSLQGRLHEVWPFRLYPKAIARGEHFFQQHGGKSVIVGRFVGLLRPVIPIVAGAFDMPVWHFVIVDVLASLAWAPAYVLPGYMVGATLELQVHLPPHFYPVLFTSLGVLLALYLLIFRLHWQLEHEGAIYQRVREWLQRYDQSHRFWRTFSNQRTEGGRFPLASLVLGTGAIAGFTLWSLLALHTDWLRQFNHLATDFMHVLRTPWLDAAMTGITLLGNRFAIWLGFVLITLLLWIRGYRAAALHVALAGIATGILVAGLKTAFDTLRPALVLHPPASPSYPSGHATGATVLFGLLGAFIAAELPVRKRWKAYTLASVPVLLISLSRLYLGVHWFTDVVGGVLLGLVICGFTRVSYSRFDRQALSIDSLTLVALAAWLIALAIYTLHTWPAAILAYQPIS